MLLLSVKHGGIIKEFYKKKLQKWCAKKLVIVYHYLEKTNTKSILDIGCGNCVVLNDFMNNGYTVNGLDVKNLSIFNHISPYVYDGKLFPY